MVWDFLNNNQEKILGETNKAAKRIFELAKEDWLRANSKLVQSHKDGYI